MKDDNNKPQEIVLNEKQLILITTIAKSVDDLKSDYENAIMLRQEVLAMILQLNNVIGAKSVRLDGGKLIINEEAPVVA